MKLITPIYKTNYHSDSHCGNRVINISYGIDENYQIGAGISICSILENNNLGTFCFIFHIVSESYSDEFFRKIELLSEKYKAEINLYRIDRSGVEKLPKSKVWPASIYYRLASFDYFSYKMDCLLYLDADVLCKGNIEPLLDIDLSEKYAAVVIDVESMQEPSANRLNEKRLSGDYFNSGVILVNLDIWRREELAEKIFDLLRNNNLEKELKYPDQDALNLIFLGRVVKLPRRFNTVYSLKSEFENKDKVLYSQIITDHTVLIHYTGITKPWHNWADYPASSFFRKIFEISPWKKEKYIDADRQIEYKEKYKHLLYQKKYISGIFSMIIYGCKKYLGR